MDVKGKIKFIDTEQQVSAAFVKRDIVITTEEQYPQHILIQFTQDKVDLLDKFKVGEEVNVSINLRGREWTNPQGETKYFNTIQGWRISAVSATHTAQPAQPVAETQRPTTPAKQIDAFQDGQDDILF